MILLIDNYDSFSYNLYQLIGEITPDIRVIRNDELTLEEIESLSPEKIIISPGPGRPEDAGVSVEVVKHFAGKIPIFGVCLGHQAICAAFGGKITYAKKLMHGKTSEIEIDINSKIFKGLNKTIKVMRYHSLAAEENTLPKSLVITAKDEEGEIMAVEHRDFPIYGLQFHPESVMTPEGLRMLGNFSEI